MIPPAAPGSLGDEAMVVATIDAIRARFAGHIGLLRYRGGLDYPVQVDARLDLSRYFLQGGARGDELRLLAALFRYRHVALLGADVLDGFYSDDAVRLRLRLVELAAQAGACTTVLGFSLNAQPTAGAAALLRALPASVLLLARDRKSQQRLSSIVGRPVECVADTAFLLAPDTTDPRGDEIARWATGVRARGGRVVGVNLSAIAMEAAGLKRAAIVQVAHDTLERLVAARPATALLLIPHDMRGDASDVNLLRQLAARLERPAFDVRFLVPPLTARLVKRVCASVDLVWTGRMHVAIAALGQGVPIVAHEYQGKFAGLFADLGLENMLWDTDREPLPAPLTALLVEALDRADALKASIAPKRTALTARAARNIDLLRL
ncbi:MAG: hypothetical protein GZ089_00130 [Aromatoleum sp.]|nr:hypothetical protein [Aromatoleum sp.]